MNELHPMRITFCLFICSLAFVCCPAVSGQDGSSDLKQLKTELSMALLGETEALENDSLPSDFRRNFTSYGSSNIAKQFDFAVSVNKGTIVRKPISLERTWRRILIGSRPDTPQSQALEEAKGILYRELDRVDVARGLSPRTRDPSPEFLKYLEYESTAEILSRSEENDSWRLLPRFASYANFDEARRAINLKWKLFGHKNEIKTALNTLIESDYQNGFGHWDEAKDLFDHFTWPLIETKPEGRTFFEPPESRWQYSSSWTTHELKIGDKATYKFEFLRVNIDRPWLDLTWLTNPKFLFKDNLDIGELSTGVADDAFAYPDGAIANIVSEIILIRAVEKIGNEERDHPFEALSSKPKQEIGLLALVITSIPKTATKEQ